MENGINRNKLAGKIAEKGYDYTSLGAEVGASRDTISSVVSGKYRPSYRVMNALYFSLELNPEEATEIFFAKELTQDES